MTSARTVRPLRFSKILMNETPRLVTDRKEPYKSCVLTSSGGSGIIAVDCTERSVLRLQAREAAGKAKEVTSCITRSSGSTGDPQPNVMKQQSTTFIFNQTDACY